MDWKALSDRIEAAENVGFPRVIEPKIPPDKIPHMTNEELCLFVHSIFGGHVPETDLPENKEFMEEMCDRLGNNGEPIQPEDCDTDSVHDE